MKKSILIISLLLIMLASSINIITASSNEIQYGNETVLYDSIKVNIKWLDGDANTTPSNVSFAIIDVGSGRQIQTFSIDLHSQNEFNITQDIANKLYSGEYKVIELDVEGYKKVSETFNPKSGELNCTNQFLKTNNMKLSSSISGNTVLGVNGSSSNSTVNNTTNAVANQNTNSSDDNSTNPNHTVITKTTTVNNTKVIKTHDKPAKHTNKSKNTGIPIIALVIVLIAIVFSYVLRRDGK